MALYELNNGQLIRVARSIDGKLHQKYFSLIGLNKTQQRDVRKAAKAQDEAWAESQQKAKTKRVRDASTSKKHSTGVRGINLVRRPSPAFRVQIQIDGKSHVREFSIKRFGTDDAWQQAVKYLATCRGYKRPPKSWLDSVPKVPKAAVSKASAPKNAAKKVAAPKRGAGAVKKKSAKKKAAAKPKSRS